MAEYSKIMRGNFTSAGTNKLLSLPMVPDTIEIWNETAYGTTTNHLVVNAIGFAESAAGTAYTTAYNATAELKTNVITSGGFSFVSRGQPTYGAVFTISAIDHTTGVVTTSAPHGYSVNDCVVIYSNVVMKQIAGEFFSITAVGSTTTFTINIGGLVGGSDETGASCKQLFLPDLYIPQTCTIVSVSQAASAVVTTSVNHNFVVGQEVFFTIPSQYGMTQLDSLGYLTANGVPQKAIVTAISARAITINVNSTGFTAFALPTAATAALGVSFAQVAAIGDYNTGYSLNSSGNVPFLGVNNGIIGIPGSFAANTRQGVIIGTGDGTTIMHATSDVVAWRAIFPDSVLLNQ